MKETDWISWAGLKETTSDKVIAEAKKCKIPIFDDDRLQDIAARLHSFKTDKINRRLLHTNITLTAISLLSAFAAIYPLLKR